MSRFEFRPWRLSRSGPAPYMPGAMNSAGNLFGLAAILGGLAGCAMMLWFTEREFAGTAEDEARRVRYRRIGIGLAFAAIIFKAVNEYA